jgi:hypothetical protein
LVVGCWLEFIMHPGSPATGHLDAFGWFFPKILRWLLSSKLLLHVSYPALTILIYQNESPSFKVRQIIFYANYAFHQ